MLQMKAGPQVGKNIFVCDIKSIKCSQVLFIFIIIVQNYQKQWLCTLILELTGTFPSSSWQQSLDVAFVGAVFISNNTLQSEQTSEN